MTTRSYRQRCGLAAALDVVGERWTLLVLRELFAGPLRFTELLRTLPGVSSALLTERLRQVQGAGLISHDGTRYRLTEDGAALSDALSALAAWGSRRLPAEGAVTEPLWTLQTLAATAGRGGRTPGVANVEVDGTWYHLVIGRAALSARRGAHPEPTQVLHTTLAELESLREGDPATPPPLRELFGNPRESGIPSG
ncbi:winged helix-turn-helix transcriptional regulator [Pseudonocardia spinosispora]|uniref:winged helix-turn-helix transcriptional regulator n=1 Tax=Pseudonocardia spinosispora TaxID=103441 RepID=UPI0004174E14|nr:helix-turn-helix domain-containing protein [Pseudonocardia spinosispora]